MSRTIILKSDYTSGEIERMSQKERKANAIKELEEIIMLFDMGMIRPFDNIVYNSSEEKKNGEKEI